jgi:lysozyme
MTTENIGRALSAGWTAVDSDVALEIAAHEALIRQAYKDSQGVWTWGVGLTSASGHGVERYIGKPQPLIHCLAVYAWALNRYAEAVRAAFNGYPLTKAQFTAALSFQWNTGAIGRASWVKHWKAGDIAKARAAFMEWNKPASIIGRREKERDLFFDGKWSNTGTITEYTRLTSKNTPDWSSAVRINIRQELKAALGEAPPAPPDVEPAAPSPAALAAMAALVTALIAIAALLGIDTKALKQMIP